MTLNQMKVRYTAMCPAPYVTSCVFAGPELDTLIITTAHNGEVDAPSQAGMTFICKPGVKGVVTNLFPM
jgi:sugar lactone lactonase YvrE